jgi:acetyltransferase-like isoleucine patch superfamily enzyme
MNFKKIKFLLLFYPRYYCFLLLSYITFTPLILLIYVLYKLNFFEFKDASIIVSIFPGRYGNRLRNLFYKLTLKNLGKNFRIDWLSYIVYPSVEIGNNVTIEEKCVISRCKIGNDVILAANVSLMSGKNHHYVDDLTKTFYESGGEVKHIVLENNLWIGTHAVVMEDVSSGTVIGAGSIVTKKFLPNAIIGGIPAKVIRERGKK